MSDQKANKEDEKRAAKILKETQRARTFKPPFHKAELDYFVASIDEVLRLTVNHKIKKEANSLLQSLLTIQAQALRLQLDLIYRDYGLSAPS